MRYWILQLLSRLLRVALHQKKTQKSKIFYFFFGESVLFGVRRPFALDRAADSSRLGTSYLLWYFPTFRVVAEFKVSVVVVELGLGSMNSEINQVLVANGVYVKMDWIQAAVEYQLAQSVMQQQQQLTAAFLADKVSHSTSLATTTTCLHHLSWTALRGPSRPFHTG